MKKAIQYNFFSSVFLIISLILIVLSFVFKYQSQMQISIVFFSLILYLIFSVIHHKRDHSLTFEVIFEYILIGALALMVVLGTTI